MRSFGISAWPKRVYFIQEDTIMKTSLTSLAVAVLALVGASSVFAQAASSPTREQVKKEAAAANKATQGKVPEGQDTAVPKKPIQSTKPRADVKADTAVATKAGKTAVPEGQVGVPTKPASSADRAEVKKEAAAAVKAGTTPSGQMSAPQKVDEGAAKKK
jgi:Rieske Fe-S protein